MRNKKISALLLVMAMLVALVVPVQAAETLTILSLNPMSATDNSGNSLTLERVQGLFGEDVTVAEYPTDGFVPTIDAWGSGFMDGYANEDMLVNGTVSQRQTWSTYGGSTGRSYALTLDLGAVQSVKDVIYWDTIHVSDQNLEYSEDDETTGWAAYKDTFGVSGAKVSTSLDGKTWTTETSYTPTSATKETSFARIVNGKLGRMGHAHVVSLAAAESARYVKLTLTAKSDQFNCDEVMVLGDVTATENTRMLTKNNLSDTLKAYVEAATDKAVWDSGRNLAAKQTLMTVTDQLGYATKKDTLYLQNGVLDRDVCLSGWSDANFKGEVLIDLGAPQDVDHVFVWNCIGENYGKADDLWPTDTTPKSTYVEHLQLFKNIKIYTSMTGEDGSWSDGESFAMGTRDESEIFYGNGKDYNGTTIYQRVYAAYQCDLAQTTTARYVKLEITQNIGHLGLSEVAVLGQLGEANGTKTIISGNIPTNSNYTKNIPQYMKSLGQDVTILENSKKTVSATSAQSKIDNVTFVLDGGMGSTANTSMAWGEYNRTYAEVLIDLGEKMSVEGVDAAIWAAAAGIDLASLTVSVSTDNVTFTDAYGRSSASAVTVTPIVYEGTAGAANNNQAAGIRFAPVEARYVKVRVTQSGANQVKINEILISGKFLPSATAPVFVDAAGVDFVDSWGTNGLYAKTTVSNGDGVLVAAWYDISEATPLLKQVWVQNATAGAETSLEIADADSSVAGDIYTSVEDGTGELKAFAFNSLTAIKPLGVTTLTLGE